MMANSLDFDKASDFKSILCVCTSSAPNVEKPKSELSKQYKYEGLY